MNCTTAQSLIDLKVHHAGGPLPAGHDFAGLDRHVAGCAACRAELAALLETRALLQGAGDENPTPEELTSMWTAIDAAAFVTPSRPSQWFARHRATAGYVAACIGAAVLLLVAQQLGQVRYEGRSSVVELMASARDRMANLNQVRHRAKALIVPEASMPEASGRAFAEAAGTPQDQEIWGADFGAYELSSTGPSGGDEDAARQYGLLTRSDNVTVKQFIAPSSNEEPDPTEGLELVRGIVTTNLTNGLNSINHASLREVHDFADTSNISMGYEIPFGPRDTADRDRREQSAKGDNYKSLGDKAVVLYSENRDELAWNFNENKPGAADHDGSGAELPTISTAVASAARRGGVRDFAEAPNVTADSKGSLLYWSDVEVKYSGSDELVADTNVEVSNDSNDDTRVDLFYVNGQPAELATKSSSGYTLVETDGRGEILMGMPLTATAVDAVDWDPTDEVALVGSDTIYGDIAGDSVVLGSRVLVPSSDPGAEQLAPAGSPLTLHSADDTAPIKWDIVKLGRELEGWEIAQLERNRAELGLAQAWPTDHAQPPPSAAPAPPPANRPKVIKTAEITMEVPEYAPAVAMARRIVEGLGGFVADGSTAELSGGALSGKVVARMPPERFDDIYNALKTVGRVEKEDARSADVTAEYVDLAARIESALITEARLQKLIEEKSFLDEVTALLEVERELQRVRTQIEQMQGSLRVMDNRISLSTITAFLHEPPRTVPAATLYVEVPTVEAGAEGVQRLLAEVGGRMTKGEIKKSENGTLLGSYGLTVTLDRFPELLAGLRALGRVAVSNVTGFKESDAAAPWAAKVSCSITLDLFERARQLPNGVMTIEVDVAAEALARLEPILPEHRASIITSTTKRRSDGSHEKEMKIRAPAASFGALIRALETDSDLGRVIVKNTAGEIGEIIGGAAEVLCELTLTLAEKTRQLPTGTMRIEVASTSEALRGLDPILAASRASIVSNVTRRRDDGSSEAELKLSVPAGRYAALLAGLSAEGALGRTIDKNTSGEVGVITGGAAETMCELKLTLAERIKQVPAGKMVLEVEKFDPARQQLSSLVAEKKLQVLAAGSDQRTDGTWIGGFRLGIRAADMDAVVTRLEGLGVVRSRQISGLNLGDLTTIDPTTVGVIEVTLAEKAALAPPTEKAGGAFRTRVREALEGLWESLGMIAYGLIVMLPWLVIGGAVVWLIVRARRRAKSAAVVAPAAGQE
jgi:hypothetical protein